MPRSYRPIMLEECFGKLLEKLVAKQLQYFANAKGLLPDNQFGGRERSSVTDACASLVMDIQATWKEKKIYSVLACDIQGFFDNVGHAHLQSNLAKMGIPLPLQAWVTSFVSNRFVAISFDGFCGPMAPKPDHGVPQGSPVSPILAELFASSALSIFEGSDLLIKLKAYVDDHLLGTTGKSVLANCHHLSVGYEQLANHLATLNLGLDAVKTECMHFTRSADGVRICSTPITLHDVPEPGKQFICKPSKPLRWLGIWFDSKLLWHDHIDRMSNKASSALQALTLLGNTICGVNAQQLRILYLGCVLPILIWGCEIW